jgi:hypothetical protein
MTLRHVGSHNGFIPEATGQAIAFSRSKDDFPLNRYCQYLPTPKPVGVYAKIDRDASPRVVSDADFVWADGADRPSGDWNQLRFEWVEFSVKRRNYSFRLGRMALEHNEWKAKEHHVGMVTSQAMTNRTNRVVDLLETDSNWTSGHVDTANNLNGGAGKWDTASDQPGSPQYNAIRRTLMAAARKINLDTNAVVRPRDLVLLISPEAATAVANSAEIHNYMKYAGGAAVIESKDNVNQEWGLPKSLYGFEVIVEDTPLVSTRPAAADTHSSMSGTRAYVKASDSAILMSRKGGINGAYGSPSFSTLQLYWLAPYELSVFMFDDPRHERLEGHVTDAFAEVLASPESGYKINGIL